MTTPDRVSLWRWPVEDHAAWQSLTVSDWSAERYAAALEAADAEARSRGVTVRYVTVGVAEFRAELETRGLPNTPAGRAELIGSWGAPPGMTLGLTIGVRAAQQYMGHAMVDGPRVVASGEANSVAEALDR